MVDERAVEIMNLQNDLTILPGKMNDLVHELYTLRSESDEKKNIVRIAESSTMADVEGMLGSDGKPTFSNVGKREIEMRRKLATSADYIQNLSRIDQLRELIAQKTMEFEFLSNRFSAAKAMSRLIGGD